MSGLIFTTVCKTFIKKGSFGVISSTDKIPSTPLGRLGGVKKLKVDPNSNKLERMN